MTKPCNICGEQILEIARVCKICQNPQSPLARMWRLVQGFLAIVVSVGSLSLAIIEANAANVARADTRVANEQKEEAKQREQLAVDEALSVELASKQIISALPEDVKSRLRVRFIQQPQDLTRLRNDLKTNPKDVTRKADLKAHRLLSK